MDFYRIQDKIISKEKIYRRISNMLELRAQGLSQQEVADRMGIDRTLVSRIETMGELRKGQSIAVVGFPVLNKDELQQILTAEGVDYILLMTEQERTAFVFDRTGAELMNELMNLIARVRQYDVVILLASDFRLRLMQGILDNEVIAVEIGESPLTEDKRVDIDQLRQILRAVKGARAKNKPGDGRKKS